MVIGYNKRLPVIMGRGTKVITAGHSPYLKSGMTVWITHSTVKHEPGEIIGDLEFRNTYDGIAAEMYFPDVEAMTNYIDYLTKVRDIWEAEKNA